MMLTKIQIMNRDLNLNHKCTPTHSKANIDKTLQIFSQVKTIRLKTIRIQTSHSNISNKKGKAAFLNPKYFQLRSERTLILNSSIWHLSKYTSKIITTWGNIRKRETNWTMICRKIAYHPKREITSSCSSRLFKIKLKNWICNKRNCCS